MFQVVKTRTFTHDVKVLMPSDVGHTEETLRTKFVYLDSDAISAFDLKTTDGTSRFLDAVVVRFFDLTDDDGQAIECTNDLRTQLLRSPNIRLALSAHYFNVVTKAPEGN
ncbi:MULTISPECIES: hypothetical protein [unclassified Bradyrhizobium]|uniref:hypothetical protein n=1 Tax=unclassified Bradyrhizobium TaxID=2631580 RepID=UPI0028E89C43|nr:MULTISPECIES: hypothetical protein [unclassified Bradyrhizobium]